MILALNAPIDCYKNKKCLYRILLHHKCQYIYNCYIIINECYIVAILTKMKCSSFRQHRRKRCINKAFNCIYQTEVSHAMHQDSEESFNIHILTFREFITK